MAPLFIVFGGGRGHVAGGLTGFCMYIMGVWDVVICLYLYVYMLFICSLFLNWDLLLFSLNQLTVRVC